MFPIFDIVKPILDRVLPDQKAKDAALLEMAKLEQNGELEDVKNRLSAIIAEANSADPWTSRARPSFLYVIYVMLLAAIPMGIVSAVSPVVAANIATGFKAWLDAIPEALYALFGVGYLGYVGGRSYEKKKGK